ncbi:unnamed protein product [Effrenium voratum]|nr:unnamed protein product [Effrenium voratum]
MQLRPWHATADLAGCLASPGCCVRCLLRAGSVSCAWLPSICWSVASVGAEASMLHPGRGRPLLAAVAGSTGTAISGSTACGTPASTSIPRPWLQLAEVDVAFLKKTAVKLSDLPNKNAAHAQGARCAQFPQRAVTSTLAIRACLPSSSAACRRGQGQLGALASLVSANS